MSRADVLVVVPTLGERLHYLDLALASIVSQQDVTPLVVVVASRPGDELRRVCARHPGVVVQEQHGRGLSAAINQGWREHGAGVPYWTWLGDDDLLAPGSLARVLAAMQADPGASMVYGRCAYIDESGRTRFVLRPSRLAPLIAAYGPNGIPQQGSLLRASAIERVGLLDEDLRYSMDLDLFLRLRAVGRVGYLPQVLAAFRWHAGSTTVSDLRASAAEAAVVRSRLHPRWGVLTRPWGLAGSVVGRLMRGSGAGVDATQWVRPDLAAGS